MNSGSALAKLAVLGLFLLMSGISPAAATVYEAGNDYNLYGHLFQGDVPVIGQSACCPTSAINSFIYLQNRFPEIYGARLATNPTSIADVQHIAGSEYMNVTVDVGTISPLVIWGRYIYMESRAPLQTQYSCQIAMRGDQPINGDRPDSWSSLNRPLPGFLQNTPDANGIALPTWQYIYQNLQKGADLGVTIESHCLTLRGFSFDDRNGNGAIDKGEGSVSFVDPGTRGQLSCPVWENTDPAYLSGYRYLLLDIYDRVEFISKIIAEYPALQPVPDTVQAGNILVLTTNAPYGLLTLRGGILCAVEQATWNKDLVLAREGGIFDTGSSCILTGNISGTGALDKMGSGILFLRGTNSSSGGMTLSEGTVNIVRDEDLGSPSAILTLRGGTLQAGAPLNLFRPVEVQAGLNITEHSAIDTGGYALSLNNTLSGPGELCQKGGGSLTLNGDGSGFQGTYYLTDGTLNLANTIGSRLEVKPEGLLKGSGPILGMVTNDGTINPGNSVGTLNIADNYTQGPSGRLEVELASLKSFDKLSITEDHSFAQLDGFLRPILLAGYRPPSNTVFPGIITARIGVFGTFATIENNTPILTWQPLYHTDQVDLTLTRDYAKPSLGLSHNEHAVGTMFNGVADTTGGDLAMVLNSLDNLPTGRAVADALPADYRGQGHRPAGPEPHRVHDAVAQPVKSPVLPAPAPEQSPVPG